jgi:hypothetical protein
VPPFPEVEGNIYKSVDGGLGVGLQWHRVIDDNTLDPTTPATSELYLRALDGAGVTPLYRP